MKLAAAFLLLLALGGCAGGPSLLAGQCNVSSPYYAGEAYCIARHRTGRLQP